MVKRGGKGPVLEGEVVDAEVALVRAEGGVVERFTAGVVGFWSKARALEAAAKATLVKAQALTPPKTKDDDEKIQFFIKQAKADSKVAVEQWDITSKVHAFHKRLVSARKRTEEPLDKAVELATTLHNYYVAAENRRVAEENERRRRDAEKKAADDRANELAEMERKAVEAEAASSDLSDRESRFITYYISGNNDVQSATAAGYKDAKATALRLLAAPKIIAAINARRAAALLREQAEAVKDKPLDVQVQTVKAEVSKAGGSDRDTHSAELLDEELLIDAIIGGKYNIPRNLLRIHQPTLNENARAFKELINKWPGVRYKKTTSLV